MNTAAKALVKREISAVSGEISEAEKQGRKLVVVTDKDGNLKGYRMYHNRVRCHFDRTVNIGKIRYFLGMDGWKTENGTTVGA